MEILKQIPYYIWHCLMFVYAPVYILSWVLHKVFRFFLALSYFGMLEYRIGRDIIKYLFAKSSRRDEEI